MLHWLHLTPERLKWPEQFFNRHGARTVFIARFIFPFPPVVPNLPAGMSELPWRTYLFYDLLGSAAYSTTYVLPGYFFGKQWKRMAAWLGPYAFCLIITAIVLIVLGLFFRRSLSAFWGRRCAKTPH